MKLSLRIAALFLCFVLFGCAAVERDAQSRKELSAPVDDLCSWTGMKRSGPIIRIERWRTANPGYNASVRLNVDGAVRPYVVRFDSHRHLMSFEPEPFYDLSKMSQGLGYDTVKDSKTRFTCVSAVDKLNQHLRWTWYGRPAIQQVGRDFIVTYETVSPAEQKKAMYLDPYVSFLVTSKGTIYATFFGS
jgi:hypothetical protein